MDRATRGNAAEQQTTSILEENPAQLEGDYAREKLKTDMKRLASHRHASNKKTAT